MRKASSFGGTAIRRLAAVVLLGVLGVAVLTTRPQIPGPLFEVLTALQDAVQQFALEEEQSEYTIEDLIDGGLEAEMSEDGQSCIFKDVKVWLFEGSPPIFILLWHRMWFMLETERWGIFKVIDAEGVEEALRIYRSKKAVFVGNLR